MQHVDAMCFNVAVHVVNDSLLAENLERLGNLAKTREQELELSQAFIKFSHVTKELASLMKQLVTFHRSAFKCRLNSVLCFPASAEWIHWRFLSHVVGVIALHMWNWFVYLGVGAAVKLIKASKCPGNYVIFWWSTL